MKMEQAFSESFVDCAFLLTRIKWLALMTAVFGVIALLWIFVWNILLLPE